MLEEREPAFRRGGTYVITGGLGGLGRVFAEHLAQKYDARLVLTGRSVVPETEGKLEWSEAAALAEKERAIDSSLKIRGLSEFDGLEALMDRLCSAHAADWLTPLRGVLLNWQRCFLS